MTTNTNDKNVEAKGKDAALPIGDKMGFLCLLQRMELAGIIVECFDFTTAASSSQEDALKMGEFVSNNPGLLERIEKLGFAVKDYFAQSHLTFEYDLYDKGQANERVFFCVSIGYSDADQNPSQQSSNLLDATKVITDIPEDQQVLGVGLHSLTGG